MQNILIKITKQPGFIEALFWLFALTFFAFTTPHTDQHFSLCAFHWLGYANCPGCGIGRSIGFFLHGDIASSWQMHILGIPATLFLAYRSFSLLHKNYLNHLKQAYHE
jgi:hypothetical protein